MVCRNDKPSIWGWFVQSIKHGELGIFVERLGLTWVYPKFSKEKCDPSRFVMAQLCYARKLGISQFAGVREPKDHKDHLDGEFWYLCFWPWPWDMAMDQ